MVPYHSPPLREKCPNAEFFLVSIFPYLSVFSPNALKYGPEKKSIIGHFSPVRIYFY